MSVGSSPLFSASKKLMLAAMTSKGVIAGQHRNVVTINGSCSCQSYVENQGYELKGPFFHLFSGRVVVPQGPVKVIHSAETYFRLSRFLSCWRPPTGSPQIHTG